MDTIPPPPPAQSARWPWILWGLTSAALFSVAGLFHELLPRFETYFTQLEMKQLPLLTEGVLNCRVAFLPLALAASVSGVPFARKGDLPKTQLWALAMILLLLILGATVFRAMIEPMLKIQTVLSK